MSERIIQAWLDAPMACGHPQRYRTGITGKSDDEWVQMECAECLICERNEQIAVRVGIALMEAEKAVDKGYEDWDERTVTGCKESGCGCVTVVIKQAIRAIPRDASLLEQHDAEIREQESKRVMALADAYYLEMSARKQKEHEEQLALRESVWREAAIARLATINYQVVTPKYIADALRALPSSTELLAQRDKDAVEKAWCAILKLKRIIPSELGPDELWNRNGEHIYLGDIEDAMRKFGIAITDTDTLKESIGGVTYSPPVPPRSTDVAAPSGYSEKIKRDD